MMFLHPSLFEELLNDCLNSALLNKALNLHWLQRREGEAE